MNLQSIGPRIKAARERKGFTQEELAEIVNLSPMHVSVIERGVKPPKLETLVKIANALEASADELLQDVVSSSTLSLSGSLSQFLDGLPKNEQQKILYCVKVYIDAYHSTK